jgi:hypothetical protein
MDILIRSTRNLRRHGLIWTWPVLLLLVSLPFFQNCVIEDVVDKDKLTLVLNDSLAVEQNHYDIIKIDIYESDGKTVYKEKIWSDTLKAAMKGMITITGLGENRPEVMVIKITAEYKGKVKLVYTIVKGGKENGVATLVFRDSPSPLDSPSIQKPTRVATGIRIEPSELTITLGDPSPKLKSFITPDSAPQGVTWASSDDAKGEVDSTGVFTPKLAGAITVTATAKVDDSIKTQITITIKTKPVINPDTTPVITPKPPLDSIPDSIPKVDSIPPKPKSLTIVNTLPISLDEDALPYRVNVQVNPDGAQAGLIWHSLNLDLFSCDSGLIRPLKPGSGKLRIRSQADTTVQVIIDVIILKHVRIESFAITPKTTLVYVGGVKIPLVVQLKSSDTASKFQCFSQYPDIARLDSGSLISGKSAGKTTITCSVFQFPEIQDSCLVTVKRDIPKINAGSDQNLKFGDTAKFAVRVTQEYGGIAELTWDLNADGKWDASSKDSSANLKYLFPVAGTYYPQFRVTDTEGNKDSVTVRVIVGSKAPFVEITSPGQDTLIADTSFLVVYKVDGVQKSSISKLKEGKNWIVITETNSGGIGKDSVNIQVDRTPPRVKITSPAVNFWTRNNAVTVAWSVDDTLQALENSENLAGRQGAVFIRRKKSDLVGNIGKDSVQIFRDTIGPIQTLNGSDSVRMNQGTTFTDPGSKCLDDGNRNISSRVLISGTLNTTTPGIYALTYKCSDEAGNAATDLTRKVQVFPVDNLPPATVLPVAPTTGDLPCSSAGPESDTPTGLPDIDGYVSVFNGTDFKGWWHDCQSSYSSTDPANGAIFRVDPSIKAIYSTQRGTNTGGLLMSNKKYLNYEIIFDIWPDFGNDAGFFNRSTVAGTAFETNLSYFAGSSFGGDWGAVGFTSRDFRPWVYQSETVISIPGNSSGEMSNWTTITSKQNPTAYGCAVSGCLQADYLRLFDADGWNQVRVQFYGGTAANPLIHMNSFFRKTGSTTWVPILSDTTMNQIVAPNYIGLLVHGGGRFKGPNGNWYRRIKMKELDDFGNPAAP